MPVLEWDKVGNRVYESGLDRGVLYLDDGTAVPWNGLTSVVEKFDKDMTLVYYDGMVISNLVMPGDFAGTMKAFTYPDEFLEMEGVKELSDGLFVSDQPPKAFSLSYRTQIGNDVEGNVAGYKIHLLYNVTAIPSDKTYGTENDTTSPVEFEWAITAVPEDIPGIRPTAHLIIDTRELRQELLTAIETLLYGNEDAFTFAALLPMSDLLAFIFDWYIANPEPPHLIRIIDNGDGTWVAETDAPGLIVDNGDGTFTITDANAIFDGDAYMITDTIA